MLVWFERVYRLLCLDRGGCSGCTADKCGHGSLPKCLAMVLTVAVPVRVIVRNKCHLSLRY